MKRTFLIATDLLPPSSKSMGGESTKDVGHLRRSSTNCPTNVLDTNEMRPLKKARQDESQCQEKQCLKKQRTISPTSSDIPPRISEETSIESLKQTAQMQRSQRNYVEARAILEKALALEAPKSRARMEVLTELGSLCFEMGDFDASMNYHNGALNMYLAQQGQSCFAKLAIMNLRHVAAIYMRFGKCRQALMCYHFVYKIQRGDDVECYAQEVAATLSCIGLLNYMMEQHAEALPFYQAELRLRIQIHNGNMEHEEIAIALNSIGIVHFQLDNIEAARESFLSCLRIRQGLVSDSSSADGGRRSNDHCYDLAMVYFNLAAIAMKQGDDKDACRLYHRSMELKKAVFGNHPEIAVDYQYLGQLFLDHGYSQAAIEYYTQAYKVVQALSSQQEGEEETPCAPATHPGEVQGQALSAAQKLLVIIGNIHLLEANIGDMMTHFEEAARLAEASSQDFREVVRVFGHHLYSVSKMHPPCAAEA